MRTLALLLSLAAAAAAQPIPVGSMPLSTALSPDGRYLLVLNSGYKAASISVIDTAANREIGRTQVADAWLGIAFAPKGDRVYVSGGAQAAVFEFQFAAGKLTAGRTFAVAPEAKRTAQDFIGDVTLSPDGRLVYAADLFRDSVVVINPQSGMLIESFKTGRRPYRILFHPDGKSLFVTSWTDGTLAHLQTDTGALLATVRVGAHPTDMIWREGAVEVLEGEAPIVARLFVAASNTNNVYSFGVTAAKELRLLESINLGMTPAHPLGMTPSGLGLSADGKFLYTACSDANAVAVTDVSLDRAAVVGLIPGGSYPTAARGLRDGRIALVSGQGGAVAMIPAPDQGQLERYSRTVMDAAPYRGAPVPDSALPAILHVIYVVNTAGTQGETPQRARLAKEFANVPNLTLPPGGIGWLTSAIASDYARKMWPRPVGYEAEEPTDRPGAGYLWSNAAARQITMRNYGHMVSNYGSVPPAAGRRVTLFRDPVLGPVTNTAFLGPNAAVPDSERMKAFLADLAGFEQSGQMPRLILMRLGSPDYDAALGTLVDAVRRSKFWQSTAIFVVDGSGLVISPHVRRGFTASGAYTITSPLRTIERILGLNPMTHFDAGATPLSAVFQINSTPERAN